MTVGSDFTVTAGASNNYGIVPFEASDKVLDYLNQAIAALANDGDDGKRELTEDEKDLARSVYGNSIDVDSVIINETSALADATELWPANESSRPFVFGNTINVDEPLTDAELIHELGHVWQYQTQGWGYLSGIVDEDYRVDADELSDHVNDPLGERLDSFGVEEQAEIAEEYFALREQVQHAAENFVEPSQEDLARLDIYSAYIEEFQAATRLSGADAEANEAIEEYLGEYGEATEEVWRELLDGNTTGVVRELGEGIFELQREGAEAVVEIGSGIVGDIRSLF